MKVVALLPDCVRLHRGDSRGSDLWIHIRNLWAYALPARATAYVGWHFRLAFFPIRNAEVTTDSLHNRVWASALRQGMIRRSYSIAIRSKLDREDVVIDFSFGGEVLRE